MKEEFRIFPARTLRALVDGLNELDITRDDIVQILPFNGTFNALYTIKVEYGTDDGEN